MFVSGEDEFSVPQQPPSEQRQALELEEGYAELSKECMQIKISDNNQVFFNIQDQIFYRSDRIPENETEEIEDWSRCNCCGDSTKKLKWCDFCGQLTCITCVDHQRPYPIDNPERKKLAEQVCVTCNAKFLYREALQELILKLEDKEDQAKGLEEQRAK